MRFVYVNQRCVHIDIVCGLFPLKKCPVQLWANKNNMQCEKNAIMCFDREVRVHADADKETAVARQVQKICNKCKYGEAQRIRK